LTEETRYLWQEIHSRNPISLARKSLKKPDLCGKEITEKNRSLWQEITEETLSLWETPEVTTAAIAGGQL
jgi:hypothetical protein